MTSSSSHRQELLSILVFPRQPAAFFPLIRLIKLDFLEICEVPDREEICLTAPAISAVSVLMIPAPLSVTEMNT